MIMIEWGLILLLCYVSCFSDRAEVCGVICFYFSLWYAKLPSADIMWGGRMRKGGVRGEEIGE